MRFANTFDIEQFVSLFNDGSTPNAYQGALVLDRLSGWADANSDGWAYWPKPVRSAARLIEALETLRTAYYRGGFIADISDADLKAALRPVKAFLTRQGVAHEEIIR